MTTCNIDEYLNIFQPTEIYESTYCVCVCVHVCELVLKYCSSNSL